METKHAAVQLWYVPGRAPILAAVAVAVAFIASQFVTWGGPGLYHVGGFWSWDVWYGRGWPVCFLDITDHQELVIDTNPPWASTTTTTTGTRYDWRAEGLIVDGLAAFVLPLSTMFVFERWRRRRWQFGVRSLIVLIAVIAVFVVLLRGDVEGVTAMIGRDPFAPQGPSVYLWLVSLPLAGIRDVLRDLHTELAGLCPLRSSMADASRARSVGINARSKIVGDCCRILLVATKRKERRGIFPNP